jgi:hypothetical protein
MHNNSPLSDTEVATVVGLLKKLPPGFLPFELFQQVARLVALPIVELVPLRRHDGRTEVLLFQREDEDPHWPGAWHTPGTVLRATDETRGVQEAFHRLAVEEMEGAVFYEPVFVKNVIHHQGRGTEVSAVYWAECVESPSGIFFPADDLPEDPLIASQRLFIDLAVKHFEAQL